MDDLCVFSDVNSIIVICFVKANVRLITIDIDAHRNTYRVRLSDLFYDGT